MLEQQSETILQKIARQKTTRQKLKSLAEGALGQSVPSAWYEELYIQANGDVAQIPWARNSPHPYLQDWLEVGAQHKEGKSALVIGCGLGDDAEALAQHGFKVTAFDISATAIAWCRQRFPNSQVNYLVADLFNLDPAWNQSFDLVFSCCCIQALPLNVRPQIVEAIASLVNKAGILVIISWYRDTNLESDGPPWPISDQELLQFQSLGFAEINRHIFTEGDEIFVKKIRLEYKKSS